ncbi:unnamed protein product [Diatraea saccharalis]|uniref:Protein sleepless n=1 Tax=Diatraea saccharalis TaxID=40085 RepID=A0A9N9WDU4_9NEOP|nr:unnamed protein product [Diatraea saccharalis]
MKAAIVLFVFSINMRWGATIRCYECNSANNSMCIDPTSYDQETIRKYLRFTNCEQGVYTPGPHAFFCRKIVQTILHKHHDSEVRVMRGCGWVRHHRDCYKADNEDHLETVCQCFTDDCNSALNNKYTGGLLLAAITVVMIKTLL